VRALIVTPAIPPVPGRDVHGVYGRLRMLIRAFAEIATSIEILHLLNAKASSSVREGADLDRVESAHWGVPVSVTLAPLGTRKETTWSHYGAGIFSILDQPRYFPYCGREQVEALKRSLDRASDLVLVHRLDALCPFLRLRRKLPPFFFDLDDVEHRVLMRSTFAPPIWPGKLAYLLHVPAIIAAECWGARKSLSAFVCSERDRRHLRRLGAGPAVATVTNAIDVPAAACPVAPEPNILFLGAYNYGPNTLGAERLISRILPLIHQRVPTARLVIAGKEPECIPSYRGRPAGVEFPGFVADLEALYRRCRLVCAPITGGGGTRVKLIEAAAYGKPMVATMIAAEGLDFDDGREILMADTDSAIADACVRLLQEDEWCRSLGGAARMKAQALYDRPRVQANLARLIRDALTAADRNG
jgi:glycosyltransferase involved in cell wall biosynthesis